MGKGRGSGGIWAGNEGNMEENMKEIYYATIYI